jgi:beta-galactosidase/beta-glucuronidase
MNINIPRPEYPRPDFERSEWLNLNGEWEFEFDDNNVGEIENWQSGKSFSRKINVPFCFQSELSGINEKGLNEVMWYKREVNLPENFIGKRVILNFGAVDYYAKVWVNGTYVDSHKGGNVSFKMEITRYLNKGINTILVRVEDKYEPVQPRGKQYWKETPDRCWYTATSGIWQTVWLETVGKNYLDRVRITPDIDKSVILTEFYLDHKPEGGKISLKISYKGEVVKNINFDVKDRITKFSINIMEDDYIDERHYWTPANPNLYDIEFHLYEGDKEEDFVKSYFGMRKISVENGKILLNNKPLYQRLILDQGYWAESLLTPPSDEAIVYDIEMTKKMGYNGVRKHQKIEDPRYYYWADKLGLLVWGEMPSAYHFNSEEIDNITREWTEFIKRDYNHPCIITWVPLNESWGVRNIYLDKNQQNFAIGLYYFIKGLDSTRLVSTNDGWEQVHADICGIHDYVARGEDFSKKYMDIENAMQTGIGGRMIYAKGTEYKGQPVLITEFGGIAFEGKVGWGYNGAVKDEASFLERFDSITSAIKKIPYMQGYCYTQLTDVMQEVNGLMTADRKMKVDIEAVRKINTK